MRHHVDGRLHLSELKAMDACPALYKYACEHARTMTRPMVVGAIADSIVFGNKGYAIYPGKVRNGREWDAFREANTGKTICLQSEYDDAAGAAQAVLADPVAAPLLAGCEFQRVIQWESMGVPCASGIRGERGGIDAINLRTGAIYDLKITADVEPEALAKHAWRMWWHAQGAWLVDGWNSGAGWVENAKPFMPRSSAFSLICVRSSPPHLVTVLNVPPDILDEGRRSIRLWMERYVACEAVNEWPSYTQTPIDMIKPEWMTGGLGDE